MCMHVVLKLTTERCEPRLQRFLVRQLAYLASVRLVAVT